MPNLETVQEAIRQKVIGAITGLKLGDSNLTFETFKGWPPVSTFDELAKKPLRAVLSIYPTPTFRNTTRWMPNTTSRVTTCPGIAAVKSNAIVPPNSTMTVTITFGASQTTVKQNDAVGVAIKYGLIDDGAVGIATGTSETLTTVATKLVAAINARVSLQDKISATSSGAVVTIQNLTDVQIKITANTGNIAIDQREVGRVERTFEICSWSPSNQVRAVLGTKLEQTFFKLASQVAIQDASGDYLVLKVTGDRQWDEDVQKNIYRRDILISIDYGVTVEDLAYSVLVPILEKDFSVILE